MLELRLTRLLFGPLALRLRLDLEEHELERVHHLFRRRNSLARQAFGDVAHESAMEIVLKVRILHAGNDRERIAATACCHDIQQPIELYIVRLGLELEQIAHGFVLRHDHRLMEDRRRECVGIFAHLPLGDALFLEIIGSDFECALLQRHLFAQICELLFGRSKFSFGCGTRPLPHRWRHR